MSKATQSGWTPCGVVTCSAAVALPARFCERHAKRSPAQIVADAKSPVDALAAFIAQELENWGFRVENYSDGDLRVKPVFDLALDIRVKAGKL
jgi:hypothetical protein